MSIKRLFTDFNFLNYYSTSHKLKKERELVNRIYGHYLVKLDKINTLEKKINNIDILIAQLGTAITGLLPDLIIFSITPTEYSNYIDFKIIVKNIGTLDVEASIVNILITSIDTDINIPPLTIDETFAFNIQFSFDPLGNFKDYTIMANANSTGIIEELDETNNSKQLIFTGKDEYTGTNIIVHCHNPEGKEINSITGVGNQAEIFVDNVSKGYAASNEGTHGTPIVITPGNRVVKVEFNGIIKTKNVSIVGGNTQQLFFIFDRIEQDNFEDFVTSKFPLIPTTVRYLYNIPTYTTFTNWYCQSEQYYTIGSSGVNVATSYYNGSYDLHPRGLIIDIPWHQGYLIMSYPATENKTALLMSFGAAGYPGNKLISFNTVLVSIPYDMDNLAV